MGREAWTIRVQGLCRHAGAGRGATLRNSATLRIRFAFAFAADKVLRKGEQVRVSMQVEGRS